MSFLFSASGEVLKDLSEPFAGPPECTYAVLCREYEKLGPSPSDRQTDHEYLNHLFGFNPKAGTYNSNFQSILVNAGGNA